MRYDDLCTEVTARIVEAIESGTTGTWWAPWHHTGTGALFCPTNVATNRPYSGINTLILASEALAQGYTSAVWGTYRQLQKSGGQVRRGEHGTRCVKWVTKAAKDQEHDDAEERREVLVPVVFTLFNVAQADGLEEASPDAGERPHEICEVEAFIAATGATIDYGFNSAKYRPLVDRIQVPGIDQYSKVEDHYATVLHELVHWTGHERRLARDLSGRFGDDAYAAEELVAELGAAFATARLGISNSPRPDHAAYLRHWLRVLGEDPKALFVVAAKAQAAADHLAGYSSETDRGVAA